MDCLLYVTCPDEKSASSRIDGEIEVGFREVLIVADADFCADRLCPDSAM